MEVDNAYYKKIIYKKNAFDDLKTYIKLNYANKNICLISTKSIPAEDVTNLLNSVFCGTESVEHYVARKGFCKSELEFLKDKIQKGNFSMLIAYGGGKCCDVVKYFAYKINLPYIVCPCTATSLSYFSDYCVNPYDSSASFIAKMPNKVFIQESLIKGANCYSNINGLSFLNSLRCVFVEGLISDKENERYIYLGLEKQFKKLEQEQTNILLCNEDSNLVLMDLMIDFGFFMNLLSKDFYLFKTYELIEFFDESEAFVGNGKKMLLISKTILSILKGYLELNNFKTIEMPNYERIAEIIKNNEINFKNIKNYGYFSDFINKSYIKKQVLVEKDNVYKLVCRELLKIKEFSKSVKSVYKCGIEIEENYKSLMTAVSIAPYIYGNNILIDYMASSGVLNSFLNDVGA